ncbi:MAG: 4Fe-4S dicluster domain-containing protein [Desulfobacterales bacterium]|nr:MAG: 4Fe-4S dicluster domain-containing protein [Desulfobacterales bacterium]
MVDKIISKQNLKELPAQLVEAGFRVIAPKKGAETILFGEISSYEEYDEDCLKPERSIKEMLFPRTEKLFEYRHMRKGKVQLKENEDFAPKTVLFGVRPCDAASLPIMDEVFSWDYLDDYYLKRREETCIISMACERCDEFCLCTTLGLSPASENGSDILLLKLDENAFYARVITPKGEEICSQAEELFDATSDKAPEGFKGPEIKADLEQTSPWLDNNFENEMWDELGLRCLGCGSCTYVCPTCHCFDIIDEGGLKSGARIKNWDSCGFGLFTLHASGHNPRSTQRRRYRQRIMHKFKYYIDKFEYTACVGCGRCIKACPVDINLGDILETINSKAAAENSK